MKVRIEIDKVAALKAGKDRHGLCVVEVPAETLTAAQRETLAAHHSNHGYDMDVKADFFLDRAQRGDGDLPALPSPAEPTADAVLQLLDAIPARRAAAEEKKRSELDRAVGHWLALPLEDWLGTHYFSDSGERPNYNGFEVKTWARGPGPKRPDDPRLAARLAEAQAEAARRNAEALAARRLELAEQKEKEAARKAARQAATAELRSWALAHGSPLLKARVEEDFTWEGLAEEEYARSVVDALALGLEECADVPDGYGCPERKERTTPTLPEIEALRVARAKVEAAARDDDVGVELLWLVYPPQEDDDNSYECDKDGAGPLQRGELRVTVTCPNGGEREFWFLPQTGTAVQEA